MATSKLKQVINRHLRKGYGEKLCGYELLQRIALCEVMDEVIAGYKNPLTHGYCYLDLTDKPGVREAWIEAGKPTITKENCSLFGIDETRREYF